MNKLHLVVGSVALAASFAAHAGPLARVQQGTLATPRLAPVAAMPALGAMSALPKMGNLPALAATAGGGPGPLKQYWFKYNTTQYPTELKSWAAYARYYTVQYTLIGSVSYALNPCFDGGDPCGPGNDPIGYLSHLPGVISSALNRALGLVGGGIGPIPLPKRPGDMPPGGAN